MRELNIKVIVKHCKTKDGKKEFDAYRAVQTDGTLIDCRFQAHITNIPKENFILKTTSDKVNISRRYEYPRLWVADVISFEPVHRAADAATDGDDLPF